MADYQNIPVYLNVRDRVDDLCTLVDWLEDAGMQRIILLDNASTYPPLLEYLQRSPHQVIRLKDNLGSRAIWRAGINLNEFYVFSDPDVVPISECPKDAIGYLRELLDYHPYPKAGLGLYLDDVPEIASLQWEKSLICQDREVRKGVFNSLVDTTLAVYRPNQRHTLTSLRTGFPYQMRHKPWYSKTLSEEDRYYLDRAIRGPMGSSWAEGKQI